MNSRRLEPRSTPHSVRVEVIRFVIGNPRANTNYALIDYYQQRPVELLTEDAANSVTQVVRGHHIPVLKFCWGDTSLLSPHQTEPAHVLSMWVEPQHIDKPGLTEQWEQLLSKALH